MSCYLAIDQGTHASRAIVFDADGNDIASATAEVALQRLDAAQVEQSADELRASIGKVLRDVLAQCRGKDIIACGLATQRSTVLGWNADGRAATPVLSWQDVRASAALVPLAKHAS